MLAFAAFSTLFRIARMAGEVPKITSSGGRSTTAGATRAGAEVATYPIVFSPIALAVINGFEEQRPLRSNPFALHRTEKKKPKSAKRSCYRSFRRAQSLQFCLLRSGGWVLLAAVQQKGLTDRRKSASWLAGSDWVHADNSRFRTHAQGRTPFGER